MEVVTNEKVVKVLKMKDIELSSHILIAAEEKSVLNFTSANDCQDRALEIEHISLGEINFERKSDWVRLVNKLNKYDDTPIKRVLTGDKKSSDWGVITLHREDIEYSEDGIMVEFKQPINLLLETIGDSAVIVEVNKLRGKITYEWLFTSNNNIDGLANFLSIFLYDIEIIN